MDILIYNKIKNPETKQSVVDFLGAFAESVYSQPDLFIINIQTANKVLEEVLEPLQELLLKKELHVEDTIYVFYSQGDTMVGMWPMKRQGRKRINRIPKSFTY